ncbi:MAG: peptidoglycan editing factor PgeF [Desulfobulbaceae bacterium]|nr:peptidoglycan editing factor PgeF [Desulfobulbaceae bacterium]
MHYYSSQFGGINYLVFKSLSVSDVFHGVFSRRGGVSPEPFDSLNLGLGVGDAEENVRENQARIKEIFGVRIIVSARQVHGNRVFVLEKQPSLDLEVDGYDALVTDARGVGLMVKQADCQAVLLFDPARPAVGIVHCGWRGSVSNVIRAAIEAMADVYGTDPADLKAAISPSLGPCCAEFVGFRDELPSRMHSYQVRPDYFDFWEISFHQLCDAGVGKERIFVSGLCTACNDDYFSYRRDKSTGRFASVIGLME